MPGHRVSLLRRRLGRERGGVLVIVAIFMAAAIGIATFVIDAGHWFEHKRHLQAQVDAGAFAGATTFNGCFGASAADRASSTTAAARSSLRSRPKKRSPAAFGSAPLPLASGMSAGDPCIVIAFGSRARS